jgi:aryl-alcohol dehydrogenase-like predicted oxidoreductase
MENRFDLSVYGGGAWRHPGWPGGWNMELRRVGNTDIEISIVGLGGYELGGDAGNERERLVLDAALESGINWVDTAEAYSEGQNEPTIAAAIGPRRDRILLSTKVAPEPDGTGLRPEQVRAACSTSLTRLGTEHVDLYFVHWPDQDVPLEDTWGAMRALVDEGLVRAAGLSNFDQDAIERCRAVGLVDVVQECLSPIDRLGNRDLFAWCAAEGIGVVTYEPLANGMMTGTVTSPSDFARVVGADYREWGFWKRLFSPGRFQRSKTVADGIRDLAGRIGCTMAQLAIAWNVHQTGVTATLAGTTSPAHARENAAAASIALTDDQLGELETLVRRGPSFD